MSNKKYRWAYACLVGVALLAISLSGCAAEPKVVEVEVTRVVPQTVVVTQVVEITSTPLPPTATPEIPTATPTPEKLSVLEDQMNYWCVKKDSLPSDKPWIMPVDGRAGSIVDGIPEVTFLAGTCTIVFPLSQPVADSLQVWVMDSTNAPFIRTTLIPAGDDLKVGYIVIKHPLMVDPPEWQMTYKIALRTDSNEVVWQSNFSFRNSKKPTWYCWDGTLPDVITNRCKNEIELHPWDPGFGTPGPEG